MSSFQILRASLDLSFRSSNSPALIRSPPHLACEARLRRLLFPIRPDVDLVSTALLSIRLNALWAEPRPVGIAPLSPPTGHCKCKIAGVRTAIEPNHRCFIPVFGTVTFEFKCFALIADFEGLEAHSHPPTARSVLTIGGTFRQFPTSSSSLKTSRRCRGFELCEELCKQNMRTAAELRTVRRFSSVCSSRDVAYPTRTSHAPLSLAHSAGIFLDIGNRFFFGPRRPAIGAAGKTRDPRYLSPSSARPTGAVVYPRVLAHVAERHRRAGAAECAGGSNSNQRRISLLALSNTRNPSGGVLGCLRLISGKPCSAGIQQLGPDLRWHYSRPQLVDVRVDGQPT